MRQVGDPFARNRAWVALCGHEGRVAMSVTKEVMVVGQGPSVCPSLSTYAFPYLLCALGLTGHPPASRFPFHSADRKPGCGSFGSKESQFSLALGSCMTPCGFPILCKSL